MSLELNGKIKSINETQVVGMKGFQKREFVVETDDPKYPQPIPLEFVKDKVGLLDNFSVGQTVKVEFNLRGNEYNGRTFVSLQAWKIEAVGGAPKSTAKPAAAKSATKPAAAKPAGDEDTPW